MYEKKFIFINLFNDIKIMNKKEKYTDFFYSYEFLPKPELELFVVEFLPTPELELFMVEIFLPMPELELFMVELFMGEFLPTPELELFEIEYSLAPESGIL